MSLKKIYLFTILLVITNQISSSGIKNSHGLHHETQHLTPEQHVRVAYEQLKDSYDNLIQQKYSDLGWGIAATLAVPVLAYGTKKIYDYYCEKEKEISQYAASFSSDERATMSIMGKAFYYACMGSCLYFMKKAAIMSWTQFSLVLKAENEQEIIKKEIFYMMEKINK